MSNPGAVRDELVASAERLFHRNGFAATSINDVLAETGVTKGALYHYFDGKHDLERAALEHAGKLFLAWVDAVLDGPTPRAKLERFFTSALNRHRNMGFVGGCLFGNAALELSDANPRHAAYVDSVFRAWTKKIESVISEAQGAGEIRADVPAQKLAQTVVATMEGGILLSRLRKSGEPLRTCIESLLATLGKPE